MGGVSTEEAKMVVHKDDDSSPRTDKTKVKHEDINSQIQSVKMEEVRGGMQGKHGGEGGRAAADNVYAKEENENSDNKRRKIVSGGVGREGESGYKARSSMNLHDAVIFYFQYRESQSR